MMMRSRDNQQEDAPAGVPSSELCLHSQGCEMQVSAMTPTARGSPLPSEHPQYIFSHWHFSARCLVPKIFSIIYFAL